MYARLVLLYDYKNCDTVKKWQRNWLRKYNIPSLYMNECKSFIYLSSTDNSLAPHLFLLYKNNVPSTDCTSTENKRQKLCQSVVFPHKQWTIQQQTDTENINGFPWNFYRLKSWKFNVTKKQFAFAMKTKNRCDITYIISLHAGHDKCKSQRTDQSTKLSMSGIDF